MTTKNANMPNSRAPRIVARADPSVRRFESVPNAVRVFDLCHGLTVHARLQKGLEGRPNPVRKFAGTDAGPRWTMPLSLGRGAVGERLGTRPLIVYPCSAALFALSPRDAILLLFSDEMATPINIYWQHFLGLSARRRKTGASTPRLDRHPGDRLVAILLLILL